MNKTELFKKLESAKIDWHPLNKCQAAYGSAVVDGVRVGVLKSYATIVAVAVYCNDLNIVVLERQYYSNTTSQHLAKWMRKLKAYGCPVTRHRLDFWIGNRFTGGTATYYHEMNYRPLISRVFEAGKRS